VLRVLRVYLFILISNLIKEMFKELLLVLKYGQTKNKQKHFML